MPSHLFLQRDIALGDGGGQVRLGGDAIGAGGRVGVLYRPQLLSGARLGLTWRSPVVLAYHGLADFSVDAGTPRSALPPDGKVATDLTLPQSAALGLAYDVAPWLGFEADFEWFNWSVLKRMSIELPDGSTSVDDKNWNDTFAARLGATLTFGPVAVRGGVAYDCSPVPATYLDPTLPDGSRTIAAGGLGLMLPAGVSLDLAGVYVLPIKRDTADLPGEPLYKGTFRLATWAVSVGLTIKVDTTSAKPADGDST